MRGRNGVTRHGSTRVGCDGVSVAVCSIVVIVVVVMKEQVTCRRVMRVSAAMLLGILPAKKRLFGL